MVNSQTKEASTSSANGWQIFLIFLLIILDSNIHIDKFDMVRKFTNNKQGKSSDQQPLLSYNYNIYNSNIKKQRCGK